MPAVSLMLKMNHVHHVSNFGRLFANELASVLQIGPDTVYHATSTEDTGGWVHFDLRVDDALVGEALVASGLARNKVYLQTKFTPVGSQDADAGMPYDASAPISTQVAQSITQSLKNLGTGWVDTVILHVPYENYEDTLEVKSL